jgi:hypothetical protein
LDDNATSEGDTVYDASGFGNNGTLYGDNGSGDNGSGMDCNVTGKYSTACEFDDTDDYISIAYDPVFDITEDFTFAFWIKQNVVTNQCGAITKTDFNSWWDYEIGISGDNSNGKPYIYVDTPGYTSVVADNALPDTNWHHVLVTRSGSTVTFYTDGKADGGGTLSGSLAAHSVPLQIGTSANSGQYFCNGYLDDIRIYNYSVTQQQVNDIYNYGAVSFQ